MDFLSIEQCPVLRFVIDFNLGMVGSHMTLTTRSRLSCQSHRSQVSGMTLCAGADRSIHIGSANRMTADTPFGRCSFLFQTGKGIGRSVHRSLMKGLREFNLFRSKRLFAQNRSIGWRCVSAAKKLLVFRCVTLTAIFSCYLL